MFQDSNSIKSTVPKNFTVTYTVPINSPLKIRDYVCQQMQVVSLSGS